MSEPFPCAPNISDKGLYENIETMIDLGSLKDYYSLLYSGHDDAGETNIPRYLLLSKSPIIIASTGTANRQKTATTHLQPESSEQLLPGRKYQLASIIKTRNFYHETPDVPSVQPSCSKMSRTVELGSVSRNEKFIPHTVTSKDAIENNSNIFVRNGDDSNVSHDGTIRAKNIETCKLQNLKNIRGIEEHSNKYKLSLSDEIINFNSQSDSSNEDVTSIQFISCKYECCGTLVDAPELLIDDLYCSLVCKNLDKKPIVTKETLLIQVCDKTTILTKPQNGKKKRKQLLKTTCSRNMVKEIQDLNEEILQISNKRSKKEKQPQLTSLLPISSPEAIDENNVDDDINYFDRKPLIDDEDVSKYFKQFHLKSAPIKLFDTPFPTEKNFFVVGQKLEGIDPKNESLFCVMTVSAVRGYRIKLHFDGYEDKYDFWVNADCPDLFYAGWCKTNSRILQPPKNYENVFDWIDYLGQCQSVAASDHNFVSTKNLDSCRNPHKFHIGGKLEALDKCTRTHSNHLIYVATVADILGNRVRIHFDGWSDAFDYWVDITSTIIHPVKWCDKNGRTLFPPKNYTDKKGRKRFNWNEYLAETKSEPVSEDAFVRRPLLEFCIEMMIEIVDLVVPSLLRVAKIVDVRGEELKILYDGFDDDYAYWVENDSPDIHPVGWSLKTNHPIELPPASTTLGSCNIRGCKGYGNSSNSLKTDHVEIIDCPYNMDAWKNAVAGFTKMLDRLKTHNV